MIRTATAAVKASAALPVNSSHPARVAAESPSTIGTNTAETRSTSRWIGALRPAPPPPGGRSGRERSRADSGRADDQSAEGVDRRPGHLAAFRYLDRNRLAGQHRLVNRRRSLLDDPVGGDLLAGRTTNRSPATRSAIGTTSSRPSRMTRASLGTELEERANGLARPALGAGLEIPAEENQRRDDSANLEVGLRVESADQDNGRPSPRGQRADRDQGVHRRGKVAGVQTAARWNGHPDQKTRVWRERRSATPSRRSAAAAPSPRR